jgi:hypothetical protein
LEAKIKVKIGKSLRAESSLQSPQELGIECSSTVIEPLSKIIKIPPFSRSQLPLVAYISTRPKEHELVERLAKCNNITNALLKHLEKEDTEHQEVLVCEFSETSKPNTPAASKANTLVLPMRVNFSLPALKIVPSILDLGTIASGTSVKTTLEIENLSNSTSFNLEVGKILNSDCFLFN